MRRSAPVSGSVLTPRGCWRDVATGIGSLPTAGRAKILWGERSERGRGCGREQDKHDARAKESDEGEGQENKERAGAGAGGREATHARSARAPALTDPGPTLPTPTQAGPTSGSGRTACARQRDAWSAARRGGDPARTRRADPDVARAQAQANQEVADAQARLMAARRSLGLLARLRAAWRGE